MNKKVTWGIIVIIIIVIAVSGVFKKDQGNQISIGLISPLTGSAASYGEPAMQSVLIAQNCMDAAVK